MKNFTIIILFSLFGLSALAQTGCNSEYVDSGGTTGNYSNNANSVITFCPDSPGETIVMTFTHFDTESNWDGMYVYDGNSVNAPKILSPNGPGFGELSTPGAFWGIQLPGPFTSSDINGCLTFAFHSDGSMSRSGWLANTTCIPTPSCLPPNSVTATAITYESALVQWQSPAGATQWEVLILPQSAPTPVAGDNGIIVNSNPYLAEGLAAATNYKMYVRTICDDETSVWSTTGYFVTAINPLTISNVPVAQLVTDVLINDPCFTVSNISSLTGTAFGSSNGIGMFTNTNDLFPLSSGIVLTTGSASNVPGPNSTWLSSGISNWLGDEDLNMAINAATGSALNSINASSIEFDFVSQNNFLNFNYVFASEEYGYFQCEFSDAVAFLLTDTTTGITTNLAVVPNTNIPVSIMSVRDVAYSYNGGCASANPEYFDTFSGGTTSGIAPTNFNGHTTEMTASAEIVPGNPYHLKIVIADRADTSYDSAVFIEANSMNIGSELCSDRLQLVAFIDDNSNGIKDPGENNFIYGSFTVQVNDGPSVNNIVSPVGTHYIYPQSDSDSFDLNYVIDAEFLPFYSLTSVSYSDLTIPNGSGSQMVYFPITVTQAFTDVSVAITPLSDARPGFPYTCEIVYKNNGTVSTSGTLTYVKDNLLSITNVSQAGTISTSTGFTYDFSNLLPYESRTLYVTLSVPNAPTVSIGDTLYNTASIPAASNDIDPDNNMASDTQTVVGSYDPNDKYESHGGAIAIDQFEAEDYLYYTIRFQNIGTASAITVRIEDMLDPQIDLSSIRMINASHSYVMQRTGNAVTWIFDDIYLPGVFQNEALSHGYVTFKVKVLPGFAAGDMIPNSAEIYFDNNDAIITNTFETVFTEALGVSDMEVGMIAMYPNPASSIVHLSAGNSQIQWVTVYDMLGKALIRTENHNGNEASVDVSHLSKGIYSVVISTSDNLKSVKKLIVQ